MSPAANDDATMSDVNEAANAASAAAASTHSRTHQRAVHRHCATRSSRSRWRGCRGSSNVAVLDGTGIELGSWVGRRGGVARSRFSIGRQDHGDHLHCRWSLSTPSHALPWPWSWQPSTPQVVEGRCACWCGAAAAGEPTPPQLSPHEAQQVVYCGSQDIHEIATFFVLLGLHA